MQNIPKTKQKRALTQSERELAYFVFKDTLCTDTIELQTAWWVLKGYAVSPNGNIYFHKDDFCADFAVQPLHIRAWFVHELVHVWQVQQGMAVLRRAFFDRRYRYVLIEGKPFWRYGIEQQAKIVEDWYVRTQTNQECSLWQACIPFVNQSFVNQPKPTPESSLASCPAELSVNPPTKSKTPI